MYQNKKLKRIITAFFMLVFGLSVRAENTAEESNISTGLS